MHTEPNSPAAQVAALAEARGLRAFAAIVAVMVAVFAIFWQTSASMVDTWARSETFKHCFLVVPAVLWFVWQARARLAATAVAPWWPGLLGVAGAGALWLAGELSNSLAPTQWAVVLMVQFAVLALFGRGWARELVFPLAFLFFAVPFGEAFTPTLIEWTADFTVAALAATGVPVFREGQHFVIPTGRWSVVEACSGIRYLMASVVVGVLYAWSMYRSPVRRVLFIGASFVVPIVANWMRAYMIVMIGHLSGNRLAVGIDHFIYGWVFFGFVILLMFWVGARWREDGPAEQETTVGARRAVAATAIAAPLMPPVYMLVAVALLIAAWPVAKVGLLASGDQRVLQPVPIEARGTWSATALPVSQWQPILEGPVRTQKVGFAEGGATVAVFIGYYRDQKQGSELVNAMNRLLPDEGGWQQIAQGRAPASLGGQEQTVRAVTLRRGDERLRVWHWYWLDGRIETSDARAKLSLAKDRLLMRSDTSAWIAISASAETDKAGDKILADFVRAMGPELQTSLAATASR